MASVVAFNMQSGTSLGECVPLFPHLTVVFGGYPFNDPTGLWSHVAGLS